jgi:hypothetical protein
MPFARFTVNVNILAAHIVVTVPCSLALPPNQEAASSRLLETL